MRAEATAVSCQAGPLPLQMKCNRPKKNAPARIESWSMSPPFEYFFQSNEQWTLRSLTSIEANLVKLLNILCLNRWFSSRLSFLTISRKFIKIIATGLGSLDDRLRLQ
jgi:hypothetical protein